MENNNRRKYELLGESHGAASNRLKKMIMFNLIVETGRDKCFQCGEPITSFEELSVEHKEPWMSAEDPRASFFDLDNIAFSHLLCNIAAAQRYQVEHGSYWAYRKGCRCSVCRAASATKVRNERARRKARELQRDNSVGRTFGS